MRRRYVVLMTALVAVVLTGIAVAGLQKNFSVHAKGGNEVPAVVTNAQGQAIFKLSKDGTELHYKLIVANIDEVFMAHIHLAAPGVNGPIAVWLYPSTAVGPGTPTGRVSGPIAEGVIVARDVQVGTFAGLLDALRTGNAYVNVHTTPNPLGEIRGNF
jgi:hypothetical protein